MVAHKKAAIELSMTTVVVIVLAMSMLILGLVLVRTIFTGATQNVVSINENVKAQIDKLFTAEDQETVLYLANSLAAIKQGETWGIGFALRNSGGANKDFKYSIDAQTPSNCGTYGSKLAVQAWIVAGSSGDSGVLTSGKTYYGLARMQVPKDAPIGCIVRYDIKSTGTADFPTFSFDVEVK
jgi:hypothetical protein